MKNSLYQSLLSRLKNKHAKLSSRFHKSVKEGEFQKQRYRKRHESIERLKSLEKRIHRPGKESGFNVSLNYKHWAFALAMGVVVSAGAQESKRTFERKNQKAVSQTVGDLPLAQTVYFDPAVRLGFSNIEDFHTGDLDGDGDIDAILVSYYDSPVIFQNQGGFSFTSSDLTTIPLGKIDKTILADFDGDGDLDLLMSNGPQNSYTQQIWTNDGAGNFTPQPGR